MQKKLSHGDALTVIVHKSMASACRFSYIRSSSRLTTFSRHLAGVMRASSFVTVSAQLLVLIVFLCLCMATGVSASNEYGQFIFYGYTCILLTCTYVCAYSNSNYM